MQKKQSVCVHSVFAYYTCVYECSVSLSLFFCMHIHVCVCALSAALRLRPLAIWADLHCARGGSEKVSRTGRHPTSRGSQPRAPGWAALRLRPLAILADSHCARGGVGESFQDGKTSHIPGLAAPGSGLGGTPLAPPRFADIRSASRTGRARARHHPPYPRVQACPPPRPATTRRGGPGATSTDCIRTARARRRGLMTSA